MASDFALATFYDLWREYARHIREAIAPLTGEQAGLRAASGQRSVGEIVAHVIEGRVFWLGEFIGETGEELSALKTWYQPGTLTTNVAELVHGLDRSWQFVEQRLTRWTLEDMQTTFPHEWRGNHYDLSRSWVVWHVLEHDLHHGGEISLTLGMHGLQAPDI
ncbi:MAG: DinB family protein [Nitrososphaerota archaeon]